jgi:hypothetical protein
MSTIFYINFLCTRNLLVKTVLLNTKLYFFLNFQETSENIYTLFITIFVNLPKCTFCMCIDQYNMS